LVFLLSYESLCVDPKSVLQTIFEHVDIAKQGKIAKSAKLVNGLQIKSPGEFKFDPLLLERAIELYDE